ncbi:MAG TPA: enolase C-terminal domain-like protein [Opitutaceae bacterium]
MKRTPDTDPRQSSPFNRRDFFTRAAAITAAGAAAAVPGSRLLAAENVDAAKALNLKITGLKTFVVDTGPGSDENYVFVKVFTDKGVVGLGEGTMTGKARTVAAAIEEHERYLVGKDPTDIEYLWQAMFRGPRYRGGPILMSALGAVDVALWDILGQALGVPLWKLLGGRARDKVKAYVKHTKQPIDPNLSDEDKLIATWVGIQKDGWTGSKGNFLIKDPDGTMDPPVAIRKGIDLLRRMREAVGPDFDIHVDVHGQCTTQMAVEFCRATEPYRPFVIEEPTQLEDIGELAHLRAHTSAPLAVGERLTTKYPFADICARHLVDYVQPDIIHCGGITEVKKIAALADAFRIEVLPHNPNSRVCTFASVHLCMSTPNATVLETSGSERERWDDLFFGTRIDYQGTFAMPPTKPGLGIELNEKEAAKYPYQPKHWHSLKFPDGAIHDR